ncbi:unnamed protein product [Phytophthora lilii]|uniref:Unnamed protein product n=1 Tax=Phytophthora lilii TaxID=2077276 RepID=A0A9W6UEU4_9STRA|nr:unnamed protein product [Phytophthora lilii]
MAYHHNSIEHLQEAGGHNQHGGAYQIVQQFISARTAGTSTLPLLKWWRNRDAMIASSHQKRLTDVRFGGDLLSDAILHMLLEMDKRLGMMARHAVLRSTEAAGFNDTPSLDLFIWTHDVYDTSSLTRTVEKTIVLTCSTILNERELEQTQASKLKHGLRSFVQVRLVQYKRTRNMQTTNTKRDAATQMSSIMADNYKPDQCKHALVSSLNGTCDEERPGDDDKK